MQEIWKDIEGYEGLYQVSNLGNVKRILYKNQYGTRIQNKILKPSVTKRGYKTITLQNKNHKTYTIHRIVAKTFIPNPNNYPCVNHKDENKLNNMVDNLEWCSHKYNSNYKNAQKNKAIALNKKVNQYDLEDNFIKRWDSIKKAGAKLGINSRNISGCCRGRCKTAGGYIWKYMEELR